MAIAIILGIIALSCMIGVVLTVGFILDRDLNS